MLAEYYYTIVYREDKNNKNVNALSTLSILETANVVITPFEVMFVSNSDCWPVTSKTTANWIIENPITKQIIECMLYK